MTQAVQSASAALHKKLASFTWTSWSFRSEAAAPGWAHWECRTLSGAPVKYWEAFGAWKKKCVAQLILLRGFRI